MAFCKFSSETVANKFTIIDNIFIEKYMKFATGEQVKVYMWGLYLCNNPQSLTTNLSTLQSFSNDLGISEDEVLKAFEYWQQQGLVQIISSNEPEIQYLPVKDAISKKLYKPEKYEQFNLQAQNIIKDRQITQNEYKQYYDIIEVFHMAPEALLMIMQYCVDNKDTKVGYSYILTVAKNWAYENILTLKQVEDKLQEYNTANANLHKILKAMGLSRNPNLEEQQLYLKWTKKLGFEFDTILFVASETKKGGFYKLDVKLTKYYELHLFSNKEIQEYEKNKENLLILAKEINKIIGVYYENVETVVENYINPWMMRGYSPETLELIANYCFKNSIRNLQGMDNIIQKLFQQGLVSIESIAQFVDKAKKQDENIKKILSTAKLLRNVTSLDRDFYRNWTYTWNMSQEMIEYAASLSSDKSQPMQYINKILGNWFEQKITNLELAKQDKTLYKYNSKNNDIEIHSRKYTKEELDNIFSKIEEVEI